MKKTMFAFCAVCCSLWLDAAENPVYALHPDDITFHASFNAGDCNADMASSPDRQLLPMVFSVANHCSPEKCCMTE